MTTLHQDDEANNIKFVQTPSSVILRYSHLFKACLLDDFLVSGFLDIKKDRTIIMSFRIHIMRFDYIYEYTRYFSDFKRYGIFRFDMSSNISSLSRLIIWRLTNFNLRSIHILEGFWDIITILRRSVERYWYENHIIAHEYNFFSHVYLYLKKKIDYTKWYQFIIGTEKYDVLWSKADDDPIRERIQSLNVYWWNAMKYDLDQKYIKFIENDMSKEADITNRIRIINFLIRLQKFI